MRMTFIGIGIAICLLHPRSSKADDAQIRFLGLNPHGPLVLLQRGTVASPTDSACRSWAQPDQRWNALDRWGTVVGKVKVTVLDRYDVTNCDEVYVDTVKGNQGAGIFVRGDYKAPASARATLSSSQRRQLRAIIAKRDKNVVALSKSHFAKSAAFSKRMMTFVDRDGTKRAFIGGVTASIYKLDINDVWKLEWTEKRTNGPNEWVIGFSPIAVLDIDGDGVPEIIYHSNFGEWYGDSTMHFHHGKWRGLSAGIYGSTA
jgi:hypothetical protein